MAQPLERWPFEGSRAARPQRATYGHFRLAQGEVGSLDICGLHSSREPQRRQPLLPGLTSGLTSAVSIVGRVGRHV